MPDSALPDLTGRVVLVTGAGGGLGAGIALRFAQAGASVVVHHRQRPVDDLIARIVAAGGRAHAVSAELTDETACHGLVDAALAWAGRLDALVNNAGIQPVHDLAAMTVPEWQAVVDTNVTTAFACSQAAASVLGPGGSITHIASIEGLQPTAGHAHYSAAKAALIMHARAAAQEYGPRGIRVNSVSPGLIDRPTLVSDWPEGVERWTSAAPLGRVGQPEDVGNACVFLASELASWVTGHNLVVDGGISARPTW